MRCYQGGPPRTIEQLRAGLPTVERHSALEQLCDEAALRKVDVVLKVTDKLVQTGVVKIAGGDEYKRDRRDLDALILLSGTAEICRVAIENGALDTAAAELLPVIHR